MAEEPLDTEALGEEIRKLPEAELLDALEKEIRAMAEEKK